MIDTSEPTSPTEVGFLDTPGFAFGVAASGELALVADDGAGLRVIDTSEPTSPTEVGFLDTPGNARGVAVWRDLALLADQGAGLAIVRFRAPAPGDVNGDGVVDFVDLRTVAAALGTADPTADLNGDGVIDPLDLAEVAIHLER